MAGVMEGPGGAGLRQTEAEAGLLWVSLKTKVFFISQKSSLLAKSLLHQPNGSFALAGNSAVQT